LPPAVGLYWTPPWWGWNGAAYVFHAGYWGPSVGYYGGINYGFGYFGTGYAGGYWRSGRFYYNREYNNFGHRHIPWTYSKPVPRPDHNGVGWNGGVGGMPGQPSSRDQAAARARHWQPTGPQVQHFNTARSLPTLRSSTNRAGRFNNTGVVAPQRSGHQKGR